MGMRYKITTRYPHRYAVYIDDTALDILVGPKAYSYLAI